MKTKLKIKQEEGITLIALVVTIIVLLILAGISISLVLNNTGIITKATDAKNSSEMRQAQDEVNLAISYLQIEDATSTLTRENKRRILEDELRKFSADSSVSISGTGYKITHKKYDFFINEDLKISSSGKTFNAVEWDKKAAPEDVFIWKSDDPNNADYGVIIGYKKNVDNYTILRFPSRCTKISNDRNLYNSGLYKDTGDDQYTVRSYTKNILKVELPDTVEKLDESAFAGGNSGAFSFTSLERVELSKNLGKIENFTFDECENLKYIEIPDNITEIGDMSFWSCTTLQQINLPENLEEIGARTFENCEALESITIPAGVKEIKDYAFASCANLQQINLPEGLEKIGNCAFGSCGAIKSITIPAGVKEIKDYAFEGCTNLQQINLPEGLEKIGNEAFRSCGAIKSITIPESVKSIGSWAFASWTSSQTIKCKASKVGVNWDKYWNYNYGLPASSSTKISANIIFGYQDNNI